MVICLCLLMMLDSEKKSLTKIESTWRAEREQSMKGQDSWLNLVGLYWLEEGENSFGTDQNASIVLPLHSTVAVAGQIIVEAGQVRYQMGRGQRALLDGKPVNAGTLNANSLLAHNHLRMTLIERGGRKALRIRDLRTQQFINFKELDFYRPKRKMILEAEFEPFKEPQKLQIATVINTEIELWVPGILKFEIEGQTYELWPTLQSLDDDEYFIMFKDQTSGSSTYGGGRFLYIPRPVDGKTTLNFNRAINPPCAYTAYATCPLPPAENWLAVNIEAGERNYPDYEHAPE